METNNGQSHIDNLLEHECIEMAFLFFIMAVSAFVFYLAGEGTYWHLREAWWIPDLTWSHWHGVLPLRQ